jgi:predicted MFS family arabinose efflux permease
MVPWGIIGWGFPPAQASRLVAYAPDIAHLTLSLNASAIYFGIAIGTLLGGRVLDYSTPANLGIAAAAFPIVALAVLAASLRAGRVAVMQAD